MNRSLYSITAAAMIALSSAAFLPQAAMAQVGVNVVIGNAPPPPRYEAVPQARRGYVWAPGYWNWDGQRHVWAGGQWIQERGGNQYRRAEWVRENNQWRLDRGGWIAVQAQPVRYEEIRVAPPAPRYERMPQARHGYVWSPGHWEWRGRRYDWAPGVWIAERPGHVYVAPTWNQRDGRWVMEQGRWNERGPNGDRDHDGIPNRYDHNNGRDNNGRPHDRDGDGVPNRFDNTPPRPGDRDGDGVPNRNDSRPDNPRRN